MNFDKWRVKKSSKIISIIITQILTAINFHVKSSRFLKVGVSKVMFDKNRRILEKLVLVKKICVKLFFGRCVDLDLSNFRKLKFVCTVNHKNNNIKLKKENLNAKMQQFKNEKQQ